MAQKVKSIISFLDDYEWINLMTGFIMCITSIGLLTHYYLATVSQIIIIIGLMAILKGFLNFNIYLTLNPARTKGASFFILGALMNLGFGMIFILNIVTNQTFLLSLVALWLLMDSLPYMIYLFKNKLGSQYKYNPFIFTSMCLIFATALTIATLRTDLFGPVLPLAIFLMTSTLNLILLKKERTTP